MLWIKMWGFHLQHHVSFVQLQITVCKPNQACAAVCSACRGKTADGSPAFLAMPRDPMHDLAQPCLPAGAAAHASVLCCRPRQHACALLLHVEHEIDAISVSLLKHEIGMHPQPHSMRIKRAYPFVPREQPLQRMIRKVAVLQANGGPSNASYLDLLADVPGPSPTAANSSAGTQFGGQQSQFGGQQSAPQQGGQPGGQFGQASQFGGQSAGQYGAAPQPAGKQASGLCRQQSG